LSHDVVKIKAYTHVLGVRAEYAWINENYPNSERIQQSLEILELSESPYESREVRFDVIKIELAGGREKEVYFDISSFFDGQGTSMSGDSFLGRKLLSLYK
jgi:hypothetical protein